MHKSANKIWQAFLIGGFLASLMSATCFAATPEATNIEVTSITDSSVIITWQTTNAASSSGITYGITTSNDREYIDPTTSPATGGTYTLSHYLILQNLHAGTKYYFKIKSTNDDGTYRSDESTFTTLTPPTGDYLFSFAIISDLKYARGKADETGCRGRPYSYCQSTLASAVTEINLHDPAFTVIMGDNIDATYAAAASQVTSDLIPMLSTLEGVDIYGDGLNYFPEPGDHDKLTTYSGSDTWISGNLNPLTNSRAGYTNADANTSAVFNYGFNYRGYHFVFLDSIKNGTTTSSGEINTTWLNSNLNADAGKKTFIFSHFPTYDISEGLPAGITIPGEPIGAITASLNISNISAFNATLESHAQDIAAIFMGHIQDNYKTSLTLGSYSIPEVRIASLSQFPIGYAIVKVYTNGYMQTFYKVRANAISERARTLITDTTSVPASIWCQIWLGTNSARNYTETYSTISASAPTIAITSPASGSTQSGTINITGAATGEVTLRKIEFYVDSEFLVTAEVTGSSTTFAQSLNTTAFSNGTHTLKTIVYDVLSSTAEAQVSITTSNTAPLVRVFYPNGGEILSGASTVEITWTASGELTSNPISLYYSTDGGGSYANTITREVANSGSYAWTVPDISTSLARIKVVAQGVIATNVGSDESNANFTIHYSDSEGPFISIHPMAHDITDDDTPILTGVATDERNAIASVECKVNNGRWMPATAIDGTYNSSREGWYYHISSALSVGNNTLYARATDIYGNRGSETSYTFYVTRPNPSLEITLNGKTIYNGDSISATPSVEGALISAVGLDSNTLSITIDGTQEITAESITITPVDPPYTYTFSYLFTTALADGNHRLTVAVTDISGRTGTWEVLSLSVAQQSTSTTQGSVLNYPNPFSPSLSGLPANGGTYISYTLTKDSNVKVAIFDILGNKLKEINYTSGSSGGTTGYNEVYFSGLTDRGIALGNGIYVYLIIVDGQVKGKGKMTVIQ